MPHLDRDETPTERSDRNLAELLQELRVALPGVQVLFAFLLAVPFQPRFADVDAFERAVYFVTLLSSAAATALLIAPTAYHRLNFARRDKEHIVAVSGRLTIVGLAVLALAMLGAVVLVTNFMFGMPTALITGVVVGLSFAALWFAAPMARRRHTERHDVEPARRRAGATPGQDR